jgi:hypothetical protein
MRVPGDDKYVPPVRLSDEYLSGMSKRERTESLAWEAEQNRRVDKSNESE